MNHAYLPSNSRNNVASAPLLLLFILPNIILALSQSQIQSSPHMPGRLPETRTIQPYQIVYDALQIYRFEDLYESVRIKYFPSEQFPSTYHLAERMLKRATVLEPSNKSYLYFYAYMEILLGKVESAISIYETIQDRWPTEKDGRVMKAVYSKYLKEERAIFQERLRVAVEGDFKLRKRIMDALSITDQYFANKKAVKLGTPDAQYEFIVILGYALNADGSLAKESLDRLLKAVQILAKNPSLRIIVSGGVYKRGRTESFMMQEWLLGRGVPAGSIIQEDKSRDTVENAINSIRIILSQESKGQFPTGIITSPGHALRAMRVFETLTDRITFEVIPSNGVGVRKEVSREDQLAVYRDVLRACGVWAAPGIIK